MPQSARSARFARTVCARGPYRSSEDQLTSTRPRRLPCSRLQPKSPGPSLADDRERSAAASVPQPGACRRRSGVPPGSPWPARSSRWRPPDRRAAFQALPPGAQVNDDLAAGIDKTISVSGEDPTNADVVGGALTAGKPAVPWAIFRQQETNGAPPPHDQIFARSFAGGAGRRGAAAPSAAARAPAPRSAARSTSTRARTARRRRSTSQEPGAPSRGRPGMRTRAGTASATNNVFASRFDNTGDANQGKWIFGGQSRGTGGGTVPVPSLNIHTDQDAENPSVAGGSAVDPTKPGPWVTWQETTELAGRTAPTRSSSLGRSAREPRTATASRRQASRTAKVTCRRSAASASSRPASRASAPAAPTRASTSTRRATASSRTSRSPAPPTASRGSSGMRRTKAPSD